MIPSSFCVSEGAAAPKFSVASGPSELPDGAESIEVALYSMKRAPLSGPSPDCGFLALDGEGVGVATFLREVITCGVAESLVFDEAGFAAVSVEEDMDNGEDKDCSSPTFLLSLPPILAVLSG